MPCGALLFCRLRKSKSSDEKVGADAKSLVAQYAKNEHELKMQLIRLQIDQTSMEKTNKEELLSFGN